MSTSWESVKIEGLLGPVEYVERFTEDEKLAYREEQLGLTKDKFTVFLATGNNGQNSHIPFLEILKEYSSEVQAIAICGRNEKAYQELLEWKDSNQDFILYAEGYSDKVHKLIQASDVMITCGGANTAAKALFYGCPILFNCTQGKMPQEKLTLQYFTKNRAVYILKNRKSFQKYICAWKSMGTEHQETLASMKKLPPE